ncbi:MAG TPA: 2-amino-4-hydroxy-6-hydroxymethyldihydropteridine diphosphokinase [Candidatus Kapabacteria bacterium]|nr:2-amino-4-hydroxy-6-hydroxymethyldihydropteridine diphosphokinase [Candidatus Kapabacteria bacterium]
MPVAYIGLGTNIEPRAKRMQEAIDTLKKLGTAVALSSIYETTPVGYFDQADFLNTVMAIETELSVEVLHRSLKELEGQLGRQHRERWHEREIDLDLLLFGDAIIESEGLTVPHPQLHNRAFVLIPLAEIAPSVIHPILHKPVSDLLADLPIDESSIHVYS